MAEHTPDLLPCPFCGGEAVMEISMSEKGEYMPTCYGSECPANPEVYGQSEAEATERWNTRAADVVKDALYQSVKESAAERDRLKAINAELVEELKYTVQVISKLSDEIADDPNHNTALPAEAELACRKIRAAIVAATPDSTAGG